MFTDVFLLTTNPLLPLSEIFRPISMVMIFLSILFHLVVYSGFINIINWIFYGNFLSIIINQRLVLSLCWIMVLGYIGRLIHCRDIYRAFHGKDDWKNFIHQHYNSWIFIG